jgi:rusticyanin
MALHGIRSPRHRLAPLGLGALALLLAACSGARSPAGGYGPGMMGGGYGPGMMDGGSGPGAVGASVSPATAEQLGRATPSGATVDRAANTVTFTATQVRLAVLGAPSDGPDETFRVAGMTNPTIIVPAGARVTVEFVNADAGMQHDWLVTSSRPPFGSLGMMGMPVAMGAATATLPEASSTTMPATTITFDAASPGQYTYLCSVPGHAAAGMYGPFLVSGGG